MLRTFSYVLNLIGWLKLAAGVVVAVMVFWQPTGWSVSIPLLMGSQAVTALAAIVCGIFFALFLMACAEKIVWMLEVKEHLHKIQEFFTKAK